MSYNYVAPVPVHRLCRHRHYKLHAEIKVFCWSGLSGYVVEDQVGFQYNGWIKLLCIGGSSGYEAMD